MKDKKYKRKEAVKPEPTKTKQPSDTEKVLYGKIHDTAAANTLAIGNVAESVARIDRETNDFMHNMFNPNMQTLSNINKKLTAKVDILIDIILDFAGLELTKEQIKALELEEEKPGKKSKKVIADA